MCDFVKRIRKKFKNILSNNISWKKVTINFIFTFVFPLIVFTFPISDNINFLHEAIDRLKNGILFTTSFSIIATLLSTYFENNSKTVDGKLQTKNMETVNAPILIIIILVIINAIYYGRALNSPLNLLGILVQVILYIAVLMIYGYSDHRISTAETMTIEKSGKLQDEMNIDNSAKIEIIENEKVKDEIENKEI